MLTVIVVLKKIWRIWELQGLVLMSLTLQVVLIFSSGLRRRTSSWMLAIVLWLAYLIADWVATYALGQLSQEKEQSSPNGSLLAFWSPFLLLHLGGPDTITSFSLEDNELWLRHLLGLVVQVAGAGYVMVKSFISGTRLLAPALLMFTAGILKYGERTWALRCASMEALRSSMVTPPDPGPNYAKFMEEYHSSKDAGLVARIIMVKEGDTKLIEFPEESSGQEDGQPPRGDASNSYSDIVFGAYGFYGTFKRMIVDLILSFRDRTESQAFFHKLSTEQAFRVIEVELSFVYDELHTKAAVIHTPAGRSLRCLTLLSTLIAFLLFVFTDKTGYKRSDKVITYVLLIGALTLEVYSIVLMVVSLWTFAQLKRRGWDRAAARIFAVLEYFQPPSRRRWSGVMGQCNLINLCLSDKYPLMGKMMCKLGLEEFWVRRFLTGSAPVTRHLKRLLFTELKEKANSVADAADYKQFSTYRGEWVLRLNGLKGLLGWSADEVEFDESILLWHIATDICFHDSEARTDIKSSSREMSNYLLFLLVARPFMLTAGIGQIRFGDTCAEAKNFFLRGEKKPKEKAACRMLRGVETDYLPIEVKGDRSKSVLFDGCRLAKQLLEEIEDENKRWKVISAVWVEMLCYAASKCRGSYHARQLTSGGELLTHLWFLLAHVGIGEQYRIEAGHARAKLIVDP